MKYPKCKAKDVLLYRNGPKDSDPDWYCIDCIDHPEDVNPILIKISKDTWERLNDKSN